MAVAKTPKSQDEKAPQVSISPLKLVISLFLVGALLYLVFFQLLPSMIDYDEVWAAMQSLTGEQLFWLFILGSLRLIVEGWAYVPTLRGLKVWQGTLAYTTSTAWANVIPIPLDMPIRWEMYRTWGFVTDKIVLSFPLSGVFTIIVKLGLPVLALGALLLNGTTSSNVVWGFVIGLVGLLATIGVMLAVVRSKKFTIKLSNWVGSAVTWIVGRFKKTVDYDFRNEALELRKTALDVIGNRWFEEVLATFLAQMTQIVILLVVLRMLGVDESVVSAAQVFLAYSISQLILLIPITPGGMGVAEASYIHFLTLASGGAMSNEIGAAVFLFRIVTWLFVVPMGGITWGIWRLSLRSEKFAHSRNN